MKKFLLCFICFIFTFTGCRFELGKKNSLNFLSYNVQTFFDGVKNGNEYSEFSSGSSRWSLEKYETRLDRLANTIFDSCVGGPDIALLVEVENQDVVYDLCTRFSSKYAYPYGVFIPWNESPLMPALISRYPIKSVFVHQVYSTTFDSSLLRPLIEIHVDVDNRELIIFCIHWKSKLSKNGEDTEMRKKQGELLAIRINKILSENPGTTILAAGDFNESWIDENALGLWNGDSLVPVRLSDKHDLTAGYDWNLNTKKTGNFVTLYEPWLDIPEFLRGSYYYNGEWECIDHILISESVFNSADFEFKSFAPVRLPELFYKEGIPFRYEVYSGTGYSDHLPLLLTLDLK